MKEEIILIGGGGHCKSVIDVIEDSDIYRIAGIIDIPARIGEKVLGYPIIDSDDNIAHIIDSGRYSFHIAIGHILSNTIRVNLFNMLINSGAQLPLIIAKDAYVSRHAKLGKGCFIGHKAVINADVTIGVNTIINTGALIEHDTKVGDHCHISTMTTVNGACDIGDHCFLSSHVVINLGCKLAPNTTVYSGAVVTKSISQPGNHLKGIPAQHSR